MAGSITSVKKSSPYRELQIKELPLIKRKNKKNIYQYIESKDYCPICEYSGHCENTCFLANKKIIKGFWFWKKYCPIIEIHRHIRCQKCGIEWIQKFLNIEIKEINDC